MRLSLIGLGLVGMLAVACGGSDGSATGDDQNVTAGIPQSAIGSYFISTPTVGATLKIFSVQPFRFEYDVGSKTTNNTYGGIYDALGAISSDGHITYKPADDCSITLRVRNDGVELRQDGSCASESFAAGLDGTGVYQPHPKNVGDCTVTTITQIAGRLEGDNNFESGTSVAYDNQLYGVSYDREEAVVNSHVGDEVQLCLVSVPSDCPVGDDRGKVWKATNHRTNQTWSLGDSQHMCGGA